MATPRQITVQHRGQRRSCAWEERDGMVHLLASFPIKAVPAGGDPKMAAERAFEAALKARH